MFAGLKSIAFRALCDGRQFTLQNLDQLYYVPVSSVHKTTCRDMTYIYCVESDVKAKINNKTHTNKQYSSRDLKIHILCLIEVT